MSNLTRSLRVLVYAWLTLIGLTRVFAVEAPVRIMPLGDSITFGQAEPGAEGGYRDRLYTLLTSAGFNVDFVGTYSDANNPGLPDTNHQGAPGYRVDEVNASIGGWLDAVDDPDVILIQIGTNDFLQVERNETPSGVLAELDTLITTIATRRPFAKIVVSTLILSTYVPPIPYQNVNVEAKQVTFNQGLPGLVAQHVALGRQVFMVDLHPVLNSGDIYDTVHPTTTGYNKMADAWLPGITSVIAPKGTSNAPLVARVETPNDLTKLSVTFSKPVADSSTTLSNYHLSGGLTVSAASLNSAKRTITLTTSAQTPGEIYTLTVSGVRDRTTQQTIIAPLSKAMFYPNLLSNGSFETSYTGWPIHTGSQEVKTESQFSPYTTPDGEKLLAFNTGDQSPNGVLIQSFPTTVGQAYRLTYNLGIISWQYNSTQILDVNVQGSNTRLATTSTVVGYGGTGSTPAVFWFPWSHDFTANTTTTTLTFTDSSITNQSYSKDMLLDNVKIVRAGIGPYLAITSTPNVGAVVSPIHPSDLSGNGSGTTSLIRSYTTGTTVALTAPSTASGRNFQKWQLNGADIPGTGPSNRTINVTLNSNTTLNAFYDPGGTILPVAVADAYTAHEDTQLIVAAPGVLVNDSDANALPLTAAVGTIPTKGSLVLNPNGSFTYTPNVNSNGPDSFTYRVSNGTLNSSYATASINLTPVNDPPVAVNDGSIGSPFLTIAEDSSQSSSMAVLTNDSDLDGDNLTITQATSPNGSVSNSFSDTRLRFTPATNFNGPTTISYTVSDGNGGSASATVHVNVTPVNDPPAAVNDGTTGSPYLTVAEDSGLSAAMTVLANDSDPEGDNLTITNASSPNGSVSIVDSSKNIRFTPAANFNGATTVSYTISDSNGGSATATAHLTVSSVNDMPVANAQSVSVDEDGSVAIILSGSDVESSPLTFTITTPANGTLNGTGPNLTYTPSPNFFGADSFAFTVNDGALTSSSVLVSITVNPANDAPVALAQSVPTDEDTARPITLAGSDIDGDTLADFEIITQPEHGTLTGTGAGRTYTPDADYQGPDSFTFKVSDASLQSVAAAAVSITVNPVNDAPVATARSVSLNEDGSLAITLTGTDVENSPLTFSKSTCSHGTLSGTDPNVIYTPAANYSGPDSFTFTANDGESDSIPATVSITVEPVNDPPLAVDDGSPETPILTVTEDSGASVPLAVLGNDTDVDADTLAVSAASSPDGTLVINGDGTLVFTPTADFFGPTTIPYSISDGNGGTANATAHVIVTAVNDAPIATADSHTTPEDTPLAVSAPGVLANDSDQENSVLTTTLVLSVNHGTLNLESDGGFTYTPETNFNGEDSFTYQVSDGDLNSDVVTVTITVNPLNDIPVAFPRSISVDEDRSIQTTLTGSDVEGTPLIFAVSTQPANGNVTISGAVATYTPLPDYNGPDSFTFNASDGVATSPPAAVSVVVNPVDEFSQWLEGSSGGPNDDPDGDSISNALEFVLGGGPGEASNAGILPSASLVTADMDGNPGDEAYLLYTYRRSHLSQIDPSTAVDVEWATSLAGPWFTADGTHGEMVSTEPGDPVDLIKVHIPRPAGNVSLFTRLKVVINLPPASSPPPDE